MAITNLESDTMAGEQIATDKADPALCSMLIKMIEQSAEIPGPANSISPEIIAALNRERIFSMLVPTRFGGLGMDVPAAMRVIAAIAKLDGSIAWNVMTGQTGSLIPFMATEDLCERVYGHGKPCLLAGSGNPAGVAERIPQGWRINGTWPFVSGCEHAAWIGGACVMTENGAPIPAPNGRGPMIRSFVLPADQWIVEETWRGIGLKATGSHHAAVRGAIVPDDYIASFPFGEPVAPDPALHMVPEILLLSHAAVAVGIAEGAIAELMALAHSGLKQQYMPTPLAETERFRENLARLTAEQRAAAVLLEAEAQEVWNRRTPAAGLGPARCPDQVASAGWITSACLRVTEGCFELAGAGAVFEASPLAQRMQDMRVAAQHAAVHPRNYVTAGAAILQRCAPQ